MSTGLHFNSNDIVRITKTFDSSFGWSLISPTFDSACVITYLPSTGPSLLPIAGFINALSVDPGASTVFYISYFNDGGIFSGVIFSMPVAGPFTTKYQIFPTNSNGNAQSWNPGGISGIFISSDQNFASGTSLTIDLYCIRTGLSY
jgi:hypothetical protein